MSMPNIPEIDLDAGQGAAVIMTSIGMQELGLAHIINAEGEKIQAYLGTLEGQEVNKDISLEDLVELDKIVTDTLDSVAKTEMLLFFKLAEARKFIEFAGLNTINYTAYKLWEDNNDEFDVRPESLTIYLLQNGEVFKTKTITNTSGNINYVTFYNLPKTDKDGNEYVYTIDEDDSSFESSYSKTISGNKITNTLKR